MTEPQNIDPQSIAHQAELETWQTIRDETRRRLSKSVSIAILYLLAALAVGSYLIWTVASIGQDLESLYDWRYRDSNVSWVPHLVWLYAAMAVIGIVAYATVMMLIADRLPASVSWIVSAMPWVGSTMRVVSMGEFCQSIYQSVLGSQAYGDAFVEAGNSVGNASVRHWAMDSSKRIESGRSLRSVLQSSPIRDQPLSVVATLNARGLSESQSAVVWHRATEECHLLAQSRLERTILVVSTTCLLVSAMIASFAMLLSGIFLNMVIRGLSY